MSSQAEKGLVKASLESIVFRAIVDLRDEVEHGILPIQKIADHVNEGKPEQEKWTNARIGRIVAKMGFQKATYGKGNVAMIWDWQYIKQQMHKYAPEQLPAHTE